jgi:hypothetical protein
MIPNRPVHVISPPSVRNDPNRPTSVDIYRTREPGDLRVSTIVVMKKSDKYTAPSRLLPLTCLHRIQPYTVRWKEFFQ